MKALLRIAILSAAVAALASCADKKNESYREREQKSFDQWMSMYVENTVEQPLEKLDNGVYIKWHQPPKDAPTSESLELNYWMLLNYTGTTLPDKDYSQGAGKVFMSRDSLVTQHENTFSAYTHYVPQLINFSQYSSLPQGMFEALNSVKSKLNKKDKLSLYMPASLVTSLYAFTTSHGYQGSYSASLGIPVIISLEVVDIISDISDYEKKQVKDYAMNEWNMAETDTLASNFYYYLIETDVFEEEDSADEPVKVGKDGTAKMWYVGRFVDGFVFDTNIDSIGHRWRRDTTNYDTLKYTMGSSGLIDAFAKLEDTMYHNSHFKMVFKSDYGYGSSGQKSENMPSTIIQPYSPLVFEVWVEPKPKKAEEE